MLCEQTKTGEDGVLTEYLPDQFRMFNISTGKENNASPAVPVQPIVKIRPLFSKKKAVRNR